MMEYGRLDSLMSFFLNSLGSEVCTFGEAIGTNYRQRCEVSHASRNSVFEKIVG